MGKANCGENCLYSEAINLNKKALNKVRWAKTRAKGSRGRTILSDAVPDYEKVIKQLEEMRDHHQQRCRECKKGE
jgi:hypothetical protein